MIMMNTPSYAAALDHLYALGQELAPPAPDADGTPAPRRKFELAHMRTLAEALGNPQQTFPSVLIAGTNGKGSTAATLASILTAAGYRTGTCLLRGKAGHGAYRFTVRDGARANGRSAAR